MFVNPEGEGEEDDDDFETLGITRREFLEQQAEMMTIEADAKRFWKVMSLWYVGGSSFSFYLVLLGFLQVDELNIGEPPVGVVYKLKRPMGSRSFRIVPTPVSKKAVNAVKVTPPSV